MRELCIIYVTIGYYLSEISTAFYLDIGNLVVAFCWLYWIFLGKDKVEQKEKKRKKTQVVDEITKN
jgi:hypothetical protein